MKILVIAEHDNQDLNESTLHAVAAARMFSGEIEVLVAGSNCRNVCEKTQTIEGVDSVLWADNPCYEHHLAENMGALVFEIAARYQAIIAPHTTYAKNFLPRVAALLKVEQISDVARIESDTLFVRPIYAGNALAYVQSHDPIKVLTIRPTAFPKAPMILDKKSALQKVDYSADLRLSQYESSQLSSQERPQLTNAKIVVSGGRALKSAENFKLIEALAEQLNAAIGASRAAVDAGFAPNDYQVGQTGKIVAPELYIAIGISGAIQHLAGMKDSKVIVAINKDPDAPIFGLATYGLIGDLFQIVPELIAALQH